jgi:hypothetical protein
MKRSTRISLAVSILWFGFILLGSRNLMNFHGMRDEGSLVSLIVGLAVIWALKLVLGSMVDNKEG